MRMCHNAMQAFQWLLAAVLAQSGPIADIRPLLSAQGFQWTLVKQDSEIEYIGDISQGTRIYSVYLYNAVNRTNLHGINFFVVILNRTKYLGVYDSLSAHDCHIEEQTVACKTDYPGNRFEFTKQGPPQEIWIDGANSPFERASNSDSQAFSSRKH